MFSAKQDKANEELQNAGFDGNDYHTEDFSSDEEVLVTSVGESSSSGSIHSLTKCTTETLQEFESTEHKRIGNKAFGAFIQALENADIKELLSDSIELEYLFITLAENLTMTAGDWVALAGDFYGVPEAPISGTLAEGRLEGAQHFSIRQQRFLNAYNSLVRSNSDELDQLIAGIDEEDSVVKEARRKGQNVAEALQEHALESNPDYAAITANNPFDRVVVCHLPFKLVGLGNFNRYLELAKNNYDHFGKDAEIAYETGHQIALNTARQAGELLREANQTEHDWVSERKQLLLTALTQELFACHFLTDLFAAGHMRVPRRELALRAGTRKGALFSLMMHNEDGDKGLYVHEGGDDSEIWLAKGDGCLYEETSKENLDKAVEAVKAALSSIVEQFREPTQQTGYHFKDYIPDYHGHANHDPLFRINEEVIEKREQRQPPPEGTGNYSNRWHIKTTLPYLLWHGQHKHPFSKQQKKALARELEAHEWEAEDPEGQPRGRCIVQ